jgi:hypothetical protein
MRDERTLLSEGDAEYRSNPINISGTARVFILERR